MRVLHGRILTTKFKVGPKTSLLVQNVHERRRERVSLQVLFTRSGGRCPGGGMTPLSVVTDAIPCWIALKQYICLLVEELPNCATCSMKSLDYGFDQVKYAIGDALNKNACKRRPKCKVQIVFALWGARPVLWLRECPAFWDGIMRSCLTCHRWHAHSHDIA